MIPKIIHYCWFGKGLMPQSQVRCIEGWKKLMPDYIFMRWDESTFDYNKYPIAKYGYEAKRYALVADLCRFNVLAEYGGVYLDTDVELFQRLDDYLDCSFFSAIELYNEFFMENIAATMLDKDGNPLVPGTEIPHLEMLTSTIGAVKEHPMICNLRDHYNEMYADLDYAYNFRKHMNLDRLVAKYCTEYGFRYVDETQYLRDGMVIYGTGTFGYAFSPNPNFKVSYHHNAASWEWENKSRTQRHEVLFDKLGLLPVYKKCKAFKRKLKTWLGK